MNIDKIEVTENDKYFVIYPKEKTVYINDKKYDIELEKIKELIRIIRLWDNEYYNSSYFDGNNFEIVIYFDDKKETIKGTRSTPQNYEDFSNMIRSIYDRRWIEKIITI